MNRFARFPQLLTLALVGVLGLAGCSDLPMKPAEIGSASSAATVAGGASAAARDAVSLTTTRRIVGLIGGTVRAGDFTVVFPPGAISGTASVTVSQPDAARPVVELSITPASANRFRLPVLLVANAKSMDRSLLAAAYISYFNPATGRWERVANSSVSIENLTVSAPLWHFSKYRVESGGKAGW